MKLDNLQEMSDSELLDLKFKIDGEIENIRDQIDRAKADAATGEYSDRNWYWSAVRAKKIKGRQSQQIQNEMSRRKSERANDLPNIFIDVAKEQLSNELFTEILQRAQAICLRQKNSNP